MFSGQLTWTRLPQGFKNSPTLFDEALGKDLIEYRQQHPKVTLLQYVDDLLLAAETKEECQQATKDLLQELQRKGYRMSAQKAQLSTWQARYLGYNLERETRKLSPSRIQAILGIPTPQTKRQMWEFLGVVDYCHLWISGFADLAKSLYTSTGGKEDRLSWGAEQHQAFEALKQTLTSAPALALPDLEKPFQLFVTETQFLKTALV
ncbi:uncharacterized protein LOC111739349 [Pteropus vampyrus]|uniref:Uncharacterized protein LOC111739349 n=1 Tax=Pteropus vampyrus TaxID=132908 RepID=A0A6P6CFR5_PTEVA|nr:uncharacterized protein LOC111739349 [Pteropus vampyrus]